ncbi:MAG: regulatory protein RecX [Bacilli bacterium]
MKLKKIKNNKYQIILNDKIIETYEDVIIKYNLFNISNIDEEIINKENQFYEKYYHVLKLIKTKKRSKKEILKIIGEDKEILQKLEKEGLVDDFKYTEAYIHDKFLLSLDGPNKIKRNLLLQGIEEDIINENLNKITLEEIENKIIKYIEKHNKEPKKLINILINQGFDYYLILETIKKRNI